MWRFCTSIMVRNTGLEGLLSHVRDQGSEKDGGVRFVASHSSTIKLWMNEAQRFLVIS